MHWADASDGIILMENLKAKGLTMLDRVNGEGKLIWGHSMTLWTQFCPFLTTTYLYVDIFNPERGQK